MGIETVKKRGINLNVESKTKNPQKGKKVR
jgi:hypothetical protein